MKMRDEVRMQVRQFDSCTRNNLNNIRFDVKSGYDHRMKVIEICQDMMERDYDFFTRARLKENELVADIFCIPLGLIIEVQISEPTENIMRKKKMWEARGFNFITHEEWK